MNVAIDAAAATVDLTKLPRSLSPIAPRDPTTVRLERPTPPAPGEPLLCGEYGPRFVGYGPAPPPTLGQRAAPWALGILCGVTALGIEHLMGRL
jgi:hypothetical protein